jgi:hypothetical protein
MSTKFYKGLTPLLSQPSVGNQLLGRAYIGGTLAYGENPITDPDAISFINATGITNRTIQVAIENFVISLKDDNIWNYFYAIYPFVGGTESTHKFNLKNPVDTDAAYRLAFSGSWTHNSNGITGNGGTVANTFFDVGVGATTNDFHMSIYNRTNLNENRYDMGVYVPSNDMGLITRGYNTPGRFYATLGALGDYIFVSNSDARGHYIANRNPLTTTVGNGYKNGVNVLTATQIHTKPTGKNLGIGASNRDIPPDQERTSASKNYAFSSFGEGFTDAEASTFYTAVQAFQTALGRNV